MLVTRASFSENFCREQARLVGVYGAPRWRHAERRASAPQGGLIAFWDEQATNAQGATSPPHHTWIEQYICNA